MPEQAKSDGVLAGSGKRLNDLTMDAIQRGVLSEEDFRISAEALKRQAETAEAAGYHELGQSLRRAAELTGVSNEEVLAIYDALRPGRTAYNALIALAVRLEGMLNAPLNASLVREAAEAYRRRGLIPNTESTGDR